MSQQESVQGVVGGSPRDGSLWAIAGLSRTGMMLATMIVLAVLSQFFR